MYVHVHKVIKNKKGLQQVCMFEFAYVYTSRYVYAGWHLILVKVESTSFFF